jgi:hypothetical protein
VIDTLATDYRIVRSIPQQTPHPKQDFLNA